MSQFSTLSPEFRDSLRKMADALIKKKKAEAEPAAPAVVVKVAMDDPEVEVVEEGLSAAEGK